MPSPAGRELSRRRLSRGRRSRGREPWRWVGRPATRGSGASSRGAGCGRPATTSSPGCTPERGIGSRRSGESTPPRTSMQRSTAGGAVVRTSRERDTRGARAARCANCAALHGWNRLTCSCTDLGAIPCASVIFQIRDPWRLSRAAACSPHVFVRDVASHALRHDAMIEARGGRLHSMPTACPVPESRASVARAVPGTQTIETIERRSDV
jgi:hypothetical protein